MGAVGDTGWPSNSELLLDCALAVCLVCGADDELYDLLREFAHKRPRNRAVHEALALAAAALGNYEAAADVLHGLPNQSTEETARLVMLLGQVGKFSEAVDLAIDQILPAPHDTLTDMAAVVATMSAYELGAIARETTLRAYVNAGGNTGKVLLRFLEQSRKDPTYTAELLEEIWPAVIAEPPDEALQDNVFLYLRPTRTQDVDRILSLSDVVQQRRRLTQSESAKYGAALLIQRRYQAAADFTFAATRLFPTDENIGITRAVALDVLGHTAAALDVLSHFNQSSRLDLLQTRSHLLLRTGEVDAAVSLLQKALSNAKDSTQKFRLQCDLTALYANLDPTQYLEAAWRLGELADRNIEEQEGAFLAHFSHAAMAMGREVVAARVKEYRERTDAFVVRFPQSRSFRMGSISENGSPSEAFEVVKKLAGITDDRLRHLERQRKFGENAGALIPLGMRPGGLAPFCSNIVDLLAVCFRGRHDGQSSRITVGAGDIDARPADKAPIPDLATVIVLVRLGMFEKLFRLWDAVAIPKVSLETLSRLGREFFRATTNDLVDDALSAVRLKKINIIQPGAVAKQGQDFAASEFATIVEEVAAGRYNYLTADIAAYVYIEHNNGLQGRCRSLWDFLISAEEAGVITSDEHRLARLQVTSWNSYGTPISAGDVAAAAVVLVKDRDAGDVETTSRVVSKFFEGADAKDIVKRIAAVLLGVAMIKGTGGDRALEWISRTCFSEVLLARSPGFPGGADELAAHVISLIAFSISPPRDADEVQAVYRALTSVRREFNGHPEEGSFLEVLGRRGAECLYALHENGNRTDMEEEARLISRFLSCGVEGTSSHDSLANSFYARTQKLQR